MNIKLIFLSLFILLTGCSKSFIQIFDISTTNTQPKNKFFIYENDTVKITYSFWAQKGVLFFSVFNKQEKPLYIDWKNSSFIVNSNKFNYWNDELESIYQSTTISNTLKNSKMSSYYQGSGNYQGSYFVPSSFNKSVVVSEKGQYNGSANTETNFSSSSLTLSETNAYNYTFKPERLTFIPPRSYYYRSQFHLLPTDNFILNLTCKSEIKERNDNVKKQTTIYNESFNFDNSPLVFRNYLAFSFSENTQQFFYLDNEFFLTSVTEMEYRHHRGKIKGLDENGNRLYEKPYKKQTAFYIKIPFENSVFHRKKFLK